MTKEPINAAPQVQDAVPHRVKADHVPAGAAPLSPDAGLASDMMRVVARLDKYAADTRTRKLNGHADWIPVDLEDWLVISKAVAALEAPGWVRVREDVVQFLRGEQAIDGHWFGEKPLDLPMFWWRKYLAAAPLPESQK